ncbi:MAG: protein kinase [Oscillospiraceae bacterium]
MDKQYCPYCMTRVRPGESCPVCGLTAGSYVPSPHHLPPGTVLLDRYLVGRVLGEGGFGITYIGCDLRLELKVAIKEYYPVDRSTRNAAATLDVTSFMGLSAQSFERGKQKFLDEARTMARMDKQQVIVGVRDFFQANNTAYIVMEYIEGTTFSHLVEQKGGRIPPKELFQTLEPLFQALSIMHETGLIHRDISPDNLMLENGRVRLLDFGCARETSRGTETLTIALKHGYAPLEQYQQKGQGPWTDIYSLCATIYFCLTGKAPPQALDRIVEDGLLLPSKLGVDISPHQEAALLKGLMIRPNRRYQTVEELRADLYAPAPEVFVPVPETAPEPEAKTVAETAPLPETRSAAEEPPKTEEAPAPAEIDGDGQPCRARWKVPGGVWGAVAGAAALLLILLAVILPRGGGTASDPSQNPDATAGETAHVTTPEELRAALANDSVAAVIIDGQLSIMFGGTLEITKPVTLLAGCDINAAGQSITVGAGGALVIEGALYTEGLLRTEGGGTVTVTDGGELSISELWLEHESDLTLGGGARTDLFGGSYEVRKDSEWVITLCEEELFADAVHVTTFEEYRAAISSSRTTAIVIDGDFTVTDENRASPVPVLISEGVTVTAPEDPDEEEKRFSWLVNGTCLINRGTLLGALQTGDWRDDGADNPCTVVNYGTIEGALWLEDRGTLINYGEINSAFSNASSGNHIFNLGVMTHFGDEQSGDFNLTCDRLYNSGELVVTGNQYDPSVSLRGSTWMTNCGVIRVEYNGRLLVDGCLINLGSIEVESGGMLDGMGLIETAEPTSSLSMAPGSILQFSGVVTYSGDDMTHDGMEPSYTGAVDRSCLRWIPFSWSSADERTVRVSSGDELKAALADDSYTLVIIPDGMDITLDGSLTVTKGLALTSGASLTMASGDLTFEEENAFLYLHGTVDLTGHDLAVRDGAVVLDRGRISNIGSVTVSGIGSVSTGASLLMHRSHSAPQYLPGAAVTLEGGGRIINLGPLSMEQAALRVEEGTFYSLDDLELLDCTVEIGENGSFESRMSALSLDGSTVENHGSFQLDGWSGYEIWLTGTFNNYGVLEQGHDDTEDSPILQGVVNNYGVFHSWRNTYVSGILNNYGTVYTHEGFEVIPLPGAFLTGNAPQVVDD